jgi:hypothetical protein
MNGDHFVVGFAGSMILLPVKISKNSGLAQKNFTFCPEDPGVTRLGHSSIVWVMLPFPVFSAR